jgi:hypothetical protein
VDLDRGLEECTDEHVWYTMTLHFLCIHLQQVSFFRLVLELKLRYLVWTREIWHNPKFEECLWFNSQCDPWTSIVRS